MTINYSIAIVLTACGIETNNRSLLSFTSATIAIVLTACGIETWKEAGVSDELRELQ